MKKLSIYQMATCAIMAAVMCVLGPISIPIGPIPISLQVFLLFITLILLGTKLSVVSYLIYLLLGMAGLPVFSGYSGGLAKLAGPTGGYLVGFILMLFVAGFFYEKYNGDNIKTALGMVLGLLVSYAFGTIWFVVLMKCTVWYALTACVFPFIPFDIIKIILAIVLGKAIKHALNKAGLAVEN